MTMMIKTESVDIRTGLGDWLLKTMRAFFTLFVEQCSCNVRYYFCSRGTVGPKMSIIIACCPNLRKVYCVLTWINVCCTKLIRSLFVTVLSLLLFVKYMCADPNY